MGLFAKLFGTVEEPARDYARSRAQDVSAAPGKSWGRKMPAEENQYSFRGGYEEYFATVFYDAFPGYEIDRAYPREDAVVFRFLLEGRPVLVVEIMSERSSAKKLRDDCRAQGIAYLRFYHDHAGWWNTRSYVTERVRRALEG